MFYLIGSVNRIFDSEKDKVEIIEEEGVKFLRDEYGYKLGEITKQSENVFDLVEVGDLIKVNNLISEVLDFTKDDKDEIKLLFYSPCYINLIKQQSIDIIYKPNANGDYIKVWEREEE